MGMQIYFVPSCAFLAIFLSSRMRIYELLFIKFRRVWSVGVVKFLLLWKGRVYIYVLSHRQRVLVGQEDIPLAK